MKQNKHREELQKRSIAPSSGAWDHLENALETHEKKEKKGTTWFLKIASIALILVSVGFYFLSPVKVNEKTPVIAAPSTQEKFTVPTEKESINTTEVANTNEKPPIKNKVMDDSKIAATKQPEVLSEESPDKGKTSTEDIIEVAINDSITGIIEVAELAPSEEQSIDDEIEQLLRESKIKLLVKGQNPSKKVVSSQDLLNSVEEDLYMDLKQKLIEKITQKLKNPKEVVSSREN